MEKVVAIEEARRKLGKLVVEVASSRHRLSLPGGIQSGQSFWLMRNTSGLGPGGSDGRESISRGLSMLPSRLCFPDEPFTLSL